MTEIHGDHFPALAPTVGRIEDDIHVFPLRVYYEDTDAAGIVYYANYLKFAERARTEMMRQLGSAHGYLSAEHGLAFVVRRCAVDYRRPARLDDSLEIHTRLLKIGGASFEAAQAVKRCDVDLARVEIRLACIDRRGRPSRLPAVLRRRFESLSHLQQRA